MVFPSRFHLKSIMTKKGIKLIPRRQQSMRVMSLIMIFYSSATFMLSLSLLLYESL